MDRYIYIYLNIHIHIYIYRYVYMYKDIKISSNTPMFRQTFYAPH